jgi:hypothetical protein
VYFYIVSLLSPKFVLTFVTAVRAQINYIQYLTEGIFVFALRCWTQPYTASHNPQASALLLLRSRLLLKSFHATRR